MAAKAPDRTRTGVRTAGHECCQPGHRGRCPYRCANSRCNLTRTASMVASSSASRFAKGCVAAVVVAAMFARRTSTHRTPHTSLSVCHGCDSWKRSCNGFGAAIFSFKQKGAKKHDDRPSDVGVHVERPGATRSDPCRLNQTRRLGLPAAKCRERRSRCRLGSAATSVRGHEPPTLRTRAHDC